MPSARQLLRRFSRHRLRTIAAVVSTAFCVGAFSTSVLLYRTFFRTAIVPSDSDRLVQLVARSKNGIVDKFAPAVATSLKDLTGVQNDCSFFTFMQSANLNGEPRSVVVLHAASSCFETLQAHPVLGRALNRNDDFAAAAPVAVLTASIWRNTYRGDPHVIGRLLYMDGVAYRIVGVIGPGFKGPVVGFPPSIIVSGYLPLPQNAGALTGAQIPQFVLASLKPGFSPAAAATSLVAAWRRIVSPDIRSLSPEFVSARYGLDYVFRQRYSGELNGALLLSGLMLLGCLVNLIVSFGLSAAAFQYEYAIHIALGASRLFAKARLVFEIVLSIVSGGAIGFLLCLFALRWVIASLAQVYANFDAPLHTYVAPALELTGGCIVLITTVCLLSIFVLDEGGVTAALTEGRFMIGGGYGHFTQGALLFQCSFALLLVAITGSFFFTLAEVNKRALSVNQPNVYQMNLLNTPESGAGSLSKRKQERLRDEIAALPGVASATLSDTELLSGQQYPENITIQSSSGVRAGSAQVLAVDSSFLRTLHLDLVAGQNFTLRSKTAVTQEGLITASFAAACEPSCIGTLMRRKDDPSSKPISITGILPDISLLGLHNETKNILLLNYHEQPEDRLQSPVLLVRSAGEFPPDFSAIRRLATHAGAYAYKTETLAGARADQSFDERVLFAISSASCVVTLFLAAFGVVSSIALSFNRRRYEFGLRLAFGATFSSLIKQLLTNLVLLVAIGGFVGIAAGAAAMRFLQHNVTGMAHTPLAALCAVDGVLIILACAVSLIAAWTYVRRTPTNLLRSM